MKEQENQIIYFVHKGLFPENELEHIKAKIALCADLCLTDQRDAGQSYAQEIYNHQTQRMEAYMRVVPPTTVYLEISRTTKNRTLASFWSEYHKKDK